MRRKGGGHEQRVSSRGPFPQGAARGHRFFHSNSSCGTRLGTTRPGPRWWRSFHANAHAARSHGTAADDAADAPGPDVHATARAAHVAASADAAAGTTDATAGAASDAPAAAAANAARGSQSPACAGTATQHKHAIEQPNAHLRAVYSAERTKARLHADHLRQAMDGG